MADSTTAQLACCRRGVTAGGTQWAALHATPPQLSSRRDTLRNLCRSAPSTLCLPPSLDGRQPWVTHRRCASRASPRSMMDWHSLSVLGTSRARASRMKTCPHSVHSLTAASSLFCAMGPSDWIMSVPDTSWISASAATALATTIGFGSDIMSRRVSGNPRSLTSCGRRGAVRVGGAGSEPETPTLVGVPSL